MLELGQLKSPDANDAHIVNIVDWLLQYAFDQRASDIHIEPRRDKGHVRFRIDGVMHHVYELPPAVNAAVTSRLKILGRMDVAEKRRPQDGRVKTKSPDGNEIELRLSTLPTAFGEKMVARIFDPDVLLRSFQELGLGGDDNQRWQTMVGASNGIVLVTGPTGSGKTTTLYSTLKQLATPQVNVCTIEDPIEMVEPSFNQMQVQHQIKLSFASGVRSLLRQDPDIIMVGEIRDLETAEMAIQAALTGHLVISTLHTNDAPSAITRLIELGVPPYLIKATVVGVMAQRLVRTLCPHCKQPEAVDVEAWNLLTRPFKARPPAAVHATGRLSRMPRHRLSRADGRVRDPAADRRAAAADQGRQRHRYAARAGDQGRHAHVAVVRRAESRRRADDHRRSAQSHSVQPDRIARAARVFDPSFLEPRLAGAATRGMAAFSGTARFRPTARARRCVARRRTATTRGNWRGRSRSASLPRRWRWRIRMRSSRFLEARAYRHAPPG